MVVGALMRLLEAMTPRQILAYELKTGTPHIYTVDAELKPRDKRILDTVSNPEDQPDGP